MFARLALIVAVVGGGFLVSAPAPARAAGVSTTQPTKHHHHRKHHGHKKHHKPA